MTEKKLSEQNLTTLADQVSFTEKEGRSMRAVYNGRYLGTVVETDDDKAEGEDSGGVLWLYSHDRHTQLSGQAATRREAVIRLLQFDQESQD